MPLTEHRYKEYVCSRNAPLSCDQDQQFTGAKYCIECGFPATLPQKAEIRGRRGTYQINGLLGSRGIGRLYSGIQLHDSQPVVIKEYLLPNNSFNAQETRQRQDTFIRVAGVSLADGRTQDFRIVSPWEVIVDQQGERCYTVTKGKLEASQTLSQYLMEKGAMRAIQVREVLYQALQTLQFLHTQRLRLPSDQVQQGIAHGNLSLDSLLIIQINQQDFAIYLCDLALWERLFEPPSFAQPAVPKPEQDLEELGRVAFYLWVGRATDYTSRQPLDPRDGQQWPDSAPHLKQFLYRLIGLDTPFESAEAARQALRQLPPEDQGNDEGAVVTPEKEEKGIRKPLILLLLGILALLLFGGGIWYLSKSKPGKQAGTSEISPRRFDDVNGIPLGNFTYTGEKLGTWSEVLREDPISDRKLEEILTHPKSDVNTTFTYKPVVSKTLTASAPIKELQDGKVQFAITSWVDGLTNDLVTKQVAYDGLLVFVPFVKGGDNLPRALQGQISIENLRKIYTGQITNWQKIGGPDLKIKPLAPDEPEAKRQFEKIVLQNLNEQQSAWYEANVTKQPTKETQTQIRTKLEEVEKQKGVGIISYGILSKTLNQCAGYPLALVVDGNKPASQAVVRPSGQPIDPSDSLCHEKDNRLNVQAFVTNSYPLGYPVFVVYPRDNMIPGAGSKFAELLTTFQGQCLLNRVGLVPLQPMPENHLTSNACEPMPQP